MQEEEMAHGEIIIVRRGNGGGHDEHHGGVWKIAFADFMTAMMAFFLVMWLINASNEETKKAVASYFNPVKLMDTTSNPKGVRNPKYGIEQETDEETEDLTTISTSAKATAISKSADQTFDEQALFVDPYAILSEIAGGTSDGDAAPHTNKDFEPEQTTGMGLTAGTSFQDPFDPTSWSMQDNSPADRNDEPGDQIADRKGNTQLEVESDLSGNPGLLKVESDSMDEVSDEELEVEKPEELGNSEEEQTAQRAKAEDAPADDAEDKAEEEAIELADNLKREIEILLRNEDLTGLDLEVTANGEGAIVVLSDKNRNGMFSIGSARPTPALVNAMAKVGSVISSRKGWWKSAVTLTDASISPRTMTTGDCPLPVPTWHIICSSAAVYLRKGLRKLSDRRMSGSRFRMHPYLPPTDE